MSDESDAVGFETVRLYELEQIVKRRREANVPAEKDDHGRSKSPSGDLVGLADAVPAVLSSMLTVTATDVKPGLAARENLRDLAIAQAFYNSQVDRLQDPADPAWQEILDPANEPHWVPYFARTKFRAEASISLCL